MTILEKFRILESHGYYLCYMEDGTWCFGNEYLSDSDEDLFLLSGASGKDKDVAIENGFETLMFKNDKDCL